MTAPWTEEPIGAGLMFIQAEIKGRDMHEIRLAEDRYAREYRGYYPRAVGAYQFRPDGSVTILWERSATRNR